MTWWAECLPKAASFERAGRDGLLAVAPVNTQWAWYRFPISSLGSARHACFFNSALRARLHLRAVFGKAGRRCDRTVDASQCDLRENRGDLQAASHLPQSAVGQGDEIARVQTTVANMAGKINRLLEDVKAKADMESELKVAKEVQTMLLPPANLQNSHLGLASVVQFAAQCGGDWWGVLDAKDVNGSPVTILMLGDVTDHGVPSALITAAVRGGLSVVGNWVEKNAEHAIDPCWVLNHLNRAVCDSAKGRLSMTFFIAAFLHQSQKVRCANAGHPFPYLIRPGDKGGKATLKNITVAGDPLGDKITNTYTEYEELVGPSSRVFIYSDGVIDPASRRIRRVWWKQLRKPCKPARHGGRGFSIESWTSGKN